MGDIVRFGIFGLRRESAMTENRRVGLWARPLAVLLGCGILLFAVLAFLGSGRNAEAQEPPLFEVGNHCVQDYLSGAVCTANDVRIESINYLTITNQCYEEPLDRMTAVLEVLISAVPSPDRYDIGLFIALAGNSSALTGDLCYHDYLRPPVTEAPVYGDYNGDGWADIYDGEEDWWDGDGDTCGDLEEETQAFVLTEPVTLDCQDLDEDGAADAHICWSWDNNAGTACNSVKEAYPGTPSKCTCEVYNFNFNPSAVVVSEVAATPERGGYALPLAVFVLLGLGTGAVLRGRRARGG